MILQEARELAVGLMTEHGLHDWNFKFDKAVRRFGCCSHKRKMIQLSLKLTQLNKIEHVKDTILHEIAHALVDRHHGHDNVWRTKALSIGCNGERCYKSKDVVLPPKKYTGTCKKCGNTFGGSRATRSSCAKCDKKFNPDNLIVWELNKK